MSERKYPKETQEFTKNVFFYFLQDTGVDYLDEDLDDLGALFLSLTENYYEINKYDICEFNVDPASVLEKTEGLQNVLNNLILSIDNLPFHVRSHMGWGVWTFVDQAVYEQNPKLIPYDIDETKHLKAELIGISKKLGRALKKGEQAAVQYRKMKWQNLDLIALMSAINSAIIVMLIKLRLEAPKTIKGDNPWRNLVERTSAFFGVNSSNIERNWEYMTDLRERRAQAERDRTKKLYGDDLSDDETK